MKPNRRVWIQLRDFGIAQVELEGALRCRRTPNTIQVDSQ